MGRVAGEAGYLPNYYRFFPASPRRRSAGTTNSSHWSSVSTSMLWMHLPSLACGLLSLVHPEPGPAPRLGTAVVPRVAGMGGRSVFTAFWMPFRQRPAQ